MKKYLENMKEYEEIFRYIGSGSPPPYSLWDLEKFRASPHVLELGRRRARCESSYIAFWRNSERSLEARLREMKHDLYFLACLYNES